MALKEDDIKDLGLEIGEEVKPMAVGACGQTCPMNTEGCSSVCETSCNYQRETSCCEHSNQCYDCQTNHQRRCQNYCQDACEKCESYCEINCQDGCELCQSTCLSSCQDKLSEAARTTEKLSAVSAAVVVGSCNCGKI